MVNILIVEDEKNMQDIICEYLTSGNDEEAGEPALFELLFGFSCPKNWMLVNVKSTPFYKVSAV